MSYRRVGSPFSRTISQSVIGWAGRHIKSIHPLLLLLLVALWLEFLGALASDAAAAGLGAAAHEDVVDGDVHELHEEADEAHHEEAHGRGAGDTGELCRSQDRKKVSDNLGHLRLC